MNKKTEDNIQESYNQCKPYLKYLSTLKDLSELKSMCEICEAWYGEEHDYEDCLQKPCFRFFLCYNYLNWYNS